MEPGQFGSVKSGLLTVFVGGLTRADVIKLAYRAPPQMHCWLLAGGRAQCWRIYIVVLELVLTVYEHLLSKKIVYEHT